MANKQRVEDAKNQLAQLADVIELCSLAIVDQCDLEACTTRASSVLDLAARECERLAREIEAGLRQ